jgi:outer membrane protein TolC
MKKYCLLALLLMISSAIPVAGYAASEGLPALIMEPQTAENFMSNLKQAIYKHPTFLAANASVAQSSEKVNIAKSGLRPQVALESSGIKNFSSSREDPFSLFGQTQGSQDRTDASLVISQLLFDFYSTEHEIKIQENTEFADRLARDQATVKLALQMLTNCLDTASFTLLKTMIADSVARHLEITEQIKVRVESGRAPMREFSRANARLAEAKAKQINIDLKHRAALAEFRQLMPEAQACERMLTVEPGNLVFDNQMAIEEALANNPGIQESALRIKAAEENLAKEQSNLGPQITLEVRGEKYNRGEFFTSDFPDYDVYAGINFNVDLYSGGRKKSQISVAFEQLNEARYRQAELVKIITANTESLLTELNNAETRVQIFQQAFLANAESRENLKLQFVSANVSLLDLLQAERDFLESSENMVLNQRSVLLAEFTELALLGRLLAFIGEDNQTMDEDG